MGLVGRKGVAYDVQKFVGVSCDGVGELEARYATNLFVVTLARRQEAREEAEGSIDV